MMTASTYRISIGREPVSLRLLGACCRSLRRPTERRRFLTPALIVTMLCLAGHALAQANPPLEVLHAFGASGDGVAPSSGVIRDKLGNLYGTTGSGGSNDTGTVYSLVPEKDGSWKETVLYSFGPSGSSGALYPAGVVMDSSGNLFGASQMGGAYGYGTVFELTQSADGWNQTVLHSFCSPPNCTDGHDPRYTPLLDPMGNLYGTAGDVIYELSPGPSGWTETVLYTLCSQPHCVDGGSPGALIRDAAGDLYGPAQDGGSSGAGAIFRLTPGTKGKWSYTVLYNFNTTDPAQFPDAIVLHDGAIYGNTTGCGSSSCGTIFKLSRSGGNAQETDLYVFSNPANGATPQGALAFDQLGRMFGATGDGGSGCGAGCGVVFQMTPGKGATWQYQVVHQFNGDDGELPQYGVITDSAGHVFGTTLGGGAPYYGGVVFEISSPQPTAN